MKIFSLYVSVYWRAVVLLLVWLTVVLSSQAVNEIRIKNNFSFGTNFEVQVHEGQPGGETPQGYHLAGIFVGPGQTRSIQNDNTVSYGDWVVVLNAEFTAQQEKVGSSWIRQGEAHEGYAEIDRAPFPTGNNVINLESDVDDLDLFLVAPPLSDKLKTTWWDGDEALSGALFREGIDKVVGSLVPLTDKSEGGGGAGMTLTEFEGTATERMAQAQESIIDNPLGAAGTGGPVMEAATPQSEAAVEQIETLLPDALETVEFSPPSGSGDWLQVEFPSEFGGGTFDMNPFRSDRMETPALWFRYATQWLAYALLGIWVFNSFSEWLRALSVTRQSTGNPVAGGTGAQATALVNAGLITAAVVVCLTALLAWAFNSISVASLLSNFTTSPLLGIGANAFWFLDQLFPVATLLSCLVARAMFALYANGIFGVFFTVVRFFIA